MAHELPLIVQLVNETVPERLYTPPPLPPEELPLIVQLVNETVPRELSTPPPTKELPPVIVSPEIDAVTPGSIANTPLRPPPLTVTPALGPVIVSVPVVSLSSRRLPFSSMVCAVLKTDLSNVIVSAPPFKFAWPTAQANEPVPLLAVLVTTMLDRSRLSSSASNVGCIRRRFRASIDARPLLR